MYNMLYLGLILTVLISYLMVLTQSATGHRMDWLRRSTTAHKTVCNWLCAVSVQLHQNGA